MLIASPEHEADHADRIIDCEIAMSAAFQALAAEALAAGWSDDDVSQGLLHLASGYIRAIVAERRENAERKLVKQQMVKALKGAD